MGAGCVAGSSVPCRADQPCRGFEHHALTGAMVRERLPQGTANLLLLLLTIEPGEESGRVRRRQVVPQRVLGIVSAPQGFGERLEFDAGVTRLGEQADRSIRVGESERTRRSGRRERRRSPALLRAPRICTSQSFAAAGCQATIVNRAPGLHPLPTLANAATGSAKNIAPNRLTARSKVFGRNAWDWMSACTKRALVTP